MKGAGVALFEGSQLATEVTTRRLARFGHEVSHVAHDMEEARELIATLKNRDVDLAIVDSNLGVNRRDGQAAMKEIAGLFHERFGELFVIGFSSEGAMSGADFWVEKRNADSLQRIIDRIEAPQTQEA